MLSREKRLYKIDHFQVFPVSGEILALTSTKSFCLVLLNPAEISLMLYGNDFIKRPALFGSCRQASQK